MLSPMAGRIVLLKMKPRRTNDGNASACRDLGQLDGISASAAGHRIHQRSPPRSAEFLHIGARQVDRVEQKIRVAKGGEAGVNDDVLVGVAQASFRRIN